MSELGTHYGIGKWGKIIPARLKTHTDITSGLKAVCDQNGIKQGAVLFGIGSIRQLTYQVLAPKPETKLGAGYTDPQTLPGPVEVVSMHGVIFQSEDGQTLMHLHGTFSDQKGAVFGGHIVAGGNPVLATLDAVIAEVTDAKMVRQMDEEVGMGLFTPQDHFARVPD
ncbi:MAG: PPC domain-containing DNA-binding protein [Dehalococcoidales bacterium]